MAVDTAEVGHHLDEPAKAHADTWAFAVDSPAVRIGGSVQPHLDRPEQVDGERLPD